MTFLYVDGETLKVHANGTTVTLLRFAHGRRPYCERCMKALGIAVKNVQVAIKVAETHLDQVHRAPARR